MNDHNLDDLIIDNIDPKNSKTKSFLTIIALAIVVLIVAIILTKVILNDPDDKLAIEEENNSEMISPELTLQNIIKKDIVEDKLSLESTQKPKFGPVVGSEAKTDSIETLKPSTIPEKKTEIEVKPKTVEISSEPLNNDDEMKRQAAKEKLAEQKRQEEIARQEEQKLAAKRKAEEKAKKEAKRKKEHPVKQTNHTYYIQVGSFKQTPSSQFLAVIKKSGFDYKITPPSRSGTKKLLIGPYKSRAEVDAALVQVRDRINKSAFVVKK